MDPLSLAASIAGLTSLADSIFRLVFRYAKSVKDAKSDIRALSDEMRGLVGVLGSLQSVTAALEAEGEQFDPTLRTHHIGLCIETFKRI